jgi:hypothetical protein
LPPGAAPGRARRRLDFGGIVLAHGAPALEQPADRLGHIVMGCHPSVTVEVLERWVILPQDPAQARPVGVFVDGEGVEQNLMRRPFTGLDRRARRRLREAAQVSGVLVRLLPIAGQQAAPVIVQEFVGHADLVQR